MADEADKGEDKNTEDKVKEELETLSDSDLVMDNEGPAIGDLLEPKGGEDAKETEAEDKSAEKSKDDETSGESKDDSEDDAGGEDNKDAEGEGESDDASGAEDDDSDGDAGASEDSDAKVEPPADFEADQPAPELKDPGEFEPQDYSFEVELADGKTFEIKKPDDIKKLPKDADFGTPQNLIEFQASYNKMVSGIESDKQAHEEATEEYKAQKEAIDKRQDFIIQTNAGLKYLQNQGLLPKTTSEQEAMNWADPEVQKQDGIKESVEVIEYMVKETEDRQKLGLPGMTILDAFNNLQSKKLQEQITSGKKKSADARKKAGAKVAGASSTPGVSSAGDEDLIIGEGGNIHES